MTSALTAPRNASVRCKRSPLIRRPANFSASACATRRAATDASGHSAKNTRLSKASHEFLNRRGHADLAHHLPITDQSKAPRALLPHALSPADIHRTDRFFATTAARTRHTTDGNGPMGATMGQRTGQHGADHRSTDGAMAFDQPGVYAEHFLFGSVGVSHETAVKPVRTAGALSTGRGQQAAGTRLGYRQHLLTRT